MNGRWSASRLVLVMIAVLGAAACGSTSTVGADIAADSGLEVTEKLPSGRTALEVTEKLPSGRTALAGAVGEAHILWFWGAH